MAMYGIAHPPFNRQHNSILIQGLESVAVYPPPKKRIQHPFSSQLPIFSSSSTISKWDEILQDSVCRRMFNASFVGLLLSGQLAFSRLSISSKALASPLLELGSYTDAKEGFTLLIPSSWTKVDKAGATVLFEDANNKSNNLGVVVSPTRISNLEEFGTPQFVATKLIQAERRKESTKNAEIISVSQRLGLEGLQVYEFEYKIDSTRGGMKRVFSAAFATSKKLYLLNIVHSDGLDNPLDREKRMILEQVLHSFDTISST